MMRDMAIDPVHPYGPLIDSRVRLVTWNVWGRFGPWEQRQSVIGGTLAGCSPDVVAPSGSLVGGRS
jgi:hypothetical protein